MVYQAGDRERWDKQSVKPTKEAANYRYPEKCCGRCQGVYRNQEGDIQCGWLVSGNLVDLGGVCDLYRGDDEVSVAEAPDS